MKIKRRLIKTQTIEEFADEHNLTMEIHERPLYLQKELPRFHASFENAEIMENGVLIGGFGDGDTEKDAIADYAERISGQRLAINAYTESRREIDVPRLVGVEVRR